MKKEYEELLKKSRFELLHARELASIAFIEGKLVEGAIEYFVKNGFVNILTPHITKATGSCENINTLFELDYFGQKGYLVQTGQLYLEAFIPHFKKVYCIGPSFRAEQVADARHLTEFPLLEIEFQTEETGGLYKLMAYIEGTIYSMVKKVVKEGKDELANLEVDLKHLKNLKPPFKKVTYKEVLKILNNRYGYNLSFGDDLKHEHEQKVVEYFNNQPVFITHFPKKIKFFNMRMNEDDPDIVNSTDLILPMSGEAVGAAEREHNYERLVKRLKESEMLRLLEKKGGSIEDFKWYLELVKRKPIPHAGCGIGLNRVTQFVLQSSDIRSSTAFPMNKENLM
jgi:asparaginyl-tRNA synthetase